jgi:hypothetical protein
MQNFAQTELKRTISVDFTQVKGKTNKFYREVVGAGRASEGKARGKFAS